MITTEEAEAVAIKRVRPVVDVVKAVIADKIRDTYIIGKPVTVDVPNTIKRGKATYEVHRFIVDAALESFTTPSQSGSRWNATVADLAELNGPNAPMVWRIEMNAVRAPVATNHP